MNPFSPLLSELLNWDLGFMPKKESLGIKDTGYDLIGKYGEPSENWGDMMDWPNWSPIESWGIWLSKPEPIMTVLDSRLSSLINPRSKEAEAKPIMSSIMDIVRKLQASKVL